LAFALSYTQCSIGKTYEQILSFDQIMFKSWFIFPFSVFYCFYQELLRSVVFVCLFVCLVGWLTSDRLSAAMSGGLAVLRTPGGECALQVLLL